MAQDRDSESKQGEEGLCTGKLTTCMVPEPDEHKKGVHAGGGEAGVVRAYAGERCVPHRRLVQYRLPAAHWGEEYVQTEGQKKWHKVDCVKQNGKSLLTEERPTAASEPERGEERVQAPGRRGCTECHQEGKEASGTGC